MDKTNDQMRKNVIKELQTLAEDVLKLKTEHRQKRPIVIEFSGSPKAGKTSCINSLELFLKRNGFSVKIIQERASVCPVDDKQSPMFNFWTGSMSLAGMIGVLEDKNTEFDVLILDRGIFDSLCWFQWLGKNGKMETRQKEIAEQFFLMDEFVKSIDIVFAFCVNPDVSIKREYAHLLTLKPGTIMNEEVLREYLESIEETYDRKKRYFHDVFKIDTSNKTQDEVGKEVTEKTLNSLINILMEHIGYVELTDDLTKKLEEKNSYSYEEVKSYFNDVSFDIRKNVENNNHLIQPIPVAVITNKSRDKVLLIKKNNKAVSTESPEREKMLPYVGGHSRIEDRTDSSANDFLSLCRATLKREVKEEIGISVAVDDVTPTFIYTPISNKSKMHIAICFVVPVDEKAIKLRLDSQELVINRGKSKSGHFVDLMEIPFDKLECWGKAILKNTFNIYQTSEQQNQITLFDSISEGEF